jgi:hypothetical protein
MGTNNLAERKNINSINKLAEMNRMNNGMNNGMIGYQSKSSSRMTPTNNANILGALNHNSINLTQENIYTKNNTETSMY